MLNKSKIVIFHYHLFPGGVTTVIRDSIKALLKYSRHIKEITVVGGSNKGAADFFDSLPKKADLPVKWVCRPEIGYDDSPVTSDAARFLKNNLLKKYSGAIWWAHNYHIGKNLVFTRALLEAACEKPDQPMWLQIHDFPECARAGDWLVRQHSLGLPAYPQSSLIRYLVINQRDYWALIAAGLPPESVFRLPNPVVKPKIKPGQSKAVKQTRAALYALIKKRDPWSPEGALALYPVRTIRRKNILEAGLICRLIEKPLQLIVTLPGASVAESGYSRLVEAAFTRGYISGAWGIGATNHDLLSLDRLLASVDLILSSSTLEGFGYLFAQARQNDKPLVARKLDTLTDWEPLLDKNATHFYDSVKIVLPPLILRALSRKYLKKLTLLKNRLPDRARQKISEYYSSLTRAEFIDFADLTINLQWSVLEQAATDLEYTRLLSRINAPLIEKIEEKLGLTTITPGAGKIEEALGLASYARAADSLWADLAASPRETKPRDWTTDWTIENNLIDCFGRPDFFRLIYDPFSQDDAKDILDA